MSASARAHVRRRVQRFSLVCFYCGHEAGSLTTIEEARGRRCPRCGGNLALEPDTVSYAAALTDSPAR